MHCYAYNLPPVSSIIQNPPICPSAAVALCCAEVCVKQGDLHEIRTLGLTDLLPRLKKCIQESIHYLLNPDRWCIDFSAFILYHEDSLSFLTTKKDFDVL